MFREKVVIYIPKEKFHPRSFVRNVTRCCHGNRCCGASGRFDTKATKVELMSDGNIKATLEYVNTQSIFQTFVFVNSVSDLHETMGIVAAEMHFPEYNDDEMYRLYEYRDGRFYEDVPALHCSQVVVEG